LDAKKSEGVESIKDRKGDSTSEGKNEDWVIEKKWIKGISFTTRKSSRGGKRGTRQNGV